MLFEEEKLILSEKETKLQIYINKLIYELYNNKKTEVDSKKLLELLSYLTSDENISSSMKTATECCNRNITDILHKKEVDNLKNKIKYMEKNYIPKQKVKDVLDRLHISDIEPWSIYKVSGDVLFDLKELLEDK